MTTPYTLDRNYRGELRARTVVPLGFDSRELHIETSKSSRGGVSCAASVHKRTADGRGLEHCFAFGGTGDDFRRDLARDLKARATERALRTMHETHTADLAALLAAVHTHYGQPAPVAEGAAA